MSHLNWDELNVSVQKCHNAPISEVSIRSTPYYISQKKCCTFAKRHHFNHFISPHIISQCSHSP